MGEITSRRLRVALIGLMMWAGGTTMVTPQVVTQITDSRTDSTSLGAMDDSADWVYAISAADPLGTNPRHVFELFRWDTLTGAPEQLTSFARGIEPPQQWNLEPSVSDDGQLVAFVSTGDLLGTNADRSQELFVMNVDGSGLTQITDAASPLAGEILDYELSGSGNRAVFVATFDYLGGNSAHDEVGYIVDSDGTDLLQLSSAFTVGIDISDDGERVVYAEFPGPVSAVHADGTNLRALPPAAGIAFLPKISGDGSTVVFLGDPGLPDEQPGWCSVSNQQVAAVDWEGTNLKKLSGHCLGAVLAANPWMPDVSDDGDTVVYTSEDIFIEGSGVWKVNRDATGEALLSVSGDDCSVATVSGDGNRVSYRCGDPDATTGTDDNLSVMSSDGSSALQLVDGVVADSRRPALTADGAYAAFFSDGNLLGQLPASETHQLFRGALDGSELSLVTETSDVPTDVVISDDGQTLVYAAASPTGVSVYAVDADSSNLVNLGSGAFTSDASSYPNVNADGSVIVFQSGGDIVRSNRSGTVMLTLAGGSQPRMDAAGLWVTFSIGYEIYRILVSGAGLQLISHGAGLGPSFNPDIDAAGQNIVYESTGDPLGLNPEGNSEIFIWNATTQATQQLTVTASGNNTDPAISGDGAYVYFESSSPYFESNFADREAFYRIHVPSRVVERVEGLSPCEFPEFDAARPIVTNQDGRLALFSAGRDCAGRNPDDGREIYLIDRTATPRLFVSGGSDATVVSWDVASGPALYDVIRGDVSNLALPGTGNVDLGQVVCVENDSRDADTVGHEDTDPAVGTAYFYLLRGSQGINDAPGGYGGASSGEPRTPAAGGCAD